MSTTVGVRELKSGLSRYLRLAAGGESIIVCDHGRPVAILTAAPDGSAKPASTAEHVAGLAARGLVVLGVGRKRAPAGKRPRLDLSGAVRDDRGERS